MSARRRAEYSTDASLYRVPPELVAFPRHADEVVAVVETCLELGVPLTARGAGTSIAGNAVGPGVVMDLARHLRRVDDARRDLESRNPELAGDHRHVLAHEGRFEGSPLRAGDPAPSGPEGPAGAPGAAGEASGT